MAKTFAPRTSKKKRSKIDLSSLSLERDVFKRSDQKLFEGAMIENIKLSQIQLKEQVRTKFQDDSLRELAANIKINGLIQPLVVYRNESGELTLICGERRYRAMTRINQMESAPCFILENKTQEELMAIQFSENTSREELHYVDRADGILNYQKATGQSERKICQALGISKSEVHRGLLIARLPKKLRDAAKIFDIEKYVLLEVGSVKDAETRRELKKMIGQGQLTKRAQLKKALAARRQKAVPARRTNLDNEARP
ncbi:MAG: ParB/RepB/Spo0J family partition protein [Bacteriovoracales bacterium]|nr:ParB/RepB/Spo0J family partition protein [Bacteriovoracales bacterium]